MYAVTMCTLKQIVAPPTGLFGTYLAELLSYYWHDLLIKLKDTFLDTAVGPGPNFARMCG